jgi:hypothetical protein
MGKWVLCHGGEIKCCSSACLDVCAESLPQPLQNLTIKLAIESLTRGYEFLVSNALDVKEKINMD